MKNHFLVGLQFIAFVLFPCLSSSQIIDSANINNERYRQMLAKAIILDSTEQKINIASIYNDINIGKCILLPAHSMDTSVFVALNRTSAKASDLFSKNCQEVKKMNKKLIGKIHTDFAFTDINGEKHKLSDFAGKVVVLNYWFIRCKPCREEIPELNLVAGEFAGKNVVFISFASDRADELANFLKATPLKYLIVPGANSIAKQNNIYSFPTNIILDKGQKIVYFKQGYDGSTKPMSRIIKNCLD